jgi:hypothetical protein
MSARPDPHRVDDNGFTVREAAELIGAHYEVVRRLCHKVPGFARHVGPDSEWRVDPLFAAVALALRHGKRRMPTAVMIQQLPAARQIVLDFIQHKPVSPEMREALTTRLGPKLAGHFQRLRSLQPLAEPGAETAPAPDAEAQHETA